MSSEAAVEAEIVTYMRSLPRCYGIKLHGDIYQVNQPDRIFCLQGRTVVIEVKRPGAKPRPGQIAILRKWRNAGALAMWADNVDKVQRKLREAGLI